VVNRPVKKKKGNLEENARDARYAALEKVARKTRCKVVLTAHTLEDQAETIFMNLLRGTGPDGLSGIWPLRRKMQGTILIGRPFLSVSKAEILSYLKRNRYKYREDRSNQNKGFLRNWLRHDIFPRLEKRMPGFKRRIAQMGDLMREEQRHWNDELLALRPKLLKLGSQGAFLDFKGLLSYSAAVQRRFLRAELGGDLLNFEAVEKLRRWMSGPPTGGRHWQLKQGWSVERMSRSQGAPSASVFLLKNPRRKL
jgi:tRNA(Ile)-lysidine synthase